MDITDSEEELFLTQNSFSQDILQPNFSLGSIFDPVVGSDEPAPRNSCAEELSKIVSTKVEFSKAFDSGKALSLSDSLGSVTETPLKREVEEDDNTICKFAKGCTEGEIPQTKAVNFNNCTFVISKDLKLN